MIWCRMKTKCRLASGHQCKRRLPSSISRRTTGVFQRLLHASGHLFSPPRRIVFALQRHLVCGRRPSLDVHWYTWPVLASILVPLIVIASILGARVAWMWAVDFDKQGKPRISLFFRMGALLVGTWWLLPAGVVILKLFILKQDP